MVFNERSQSVNDAQLLLGLRKEVKYDLSYAGKRTEGTDLGSSLDGTGQEKGKAKAKEKEGRKLGGSGYAASRQGKASVEPLFPGEAPGFRSSHLMRHCFASQITSQISRS
jgi:hypothetical protein